MTTITLRRLLAATLVLSLPALAAETKPGDPVKGKGIFQQNCLICHGAKGKGDGPAAAGLATKPANYAERNSTEEKQLKVVTSGGASAGLSPIMPAWDETLSPQEIRDVVSYVRTVLSAPNDPAAATAQK
jgi:cytochrome c oxidase cbb3-type subunit I/II